MKMMLVKCPNCDADIKIPSDVIKGEILSCPDCGLEVEVTEIKRDKVEVKVAEIEGEDWGE
jgi:alpha-aminoadipate carrier protein LysW